METKNTIAVVVTYNRKLLLKECLTALVNLKNDNLKILVVDNASTDNTYEYISQLIDNKKVIYSNTGANLGGAGGFNYGMRKAVEMGCDYVWVMDDDCIVQDDTLAELLKFADSVNDDFGFLSSVAKWKDGSICKMNIQKTDIKNRVTDFGKNQEVQLASFVSLFLKSSTICQLGLPIKDFFIWGDDWEYTFRISKHLKSYMVAKSQVTHKCVSNIGVNISKDESDRLDRYFYAYRNERYFYRQAGFKGKFYQFCKICLHITRIIFSKCKNKKAKLNIMFKGLKAGKKFNPPIEYVYTTQHPLKVLEFTAEPLNYGGQEAFIISMYKNIHEPNISFTFCTPFECTNKNLMQLADARNDKIIYFNKEFESKNRKKYVVECAKQVLKDKNSFDVIHIHSGSIYALLNVAKIAKKAGIKKVIVHSHCGGKNNFKYKLIKFYSDMNIQKYVDLYLACSNLAAEWKFPKKIIKNNNFTVIKNGIDTEKFTFNEQIRKEYRDKLNLGSSLTLCNVGRFSEQKNHEFMLKIATSLKQKNIDFKFILIGEGELKEGIISQISAQNLQNHFILLEKRTDVAEIMMASDIFVLPSLYEGLPIVAVEAQTTGLATLCSTNITTEVKMCEECQFLELDVDVWVDGIINSKKISDRQKYADLISQAGYTAKKSANILKDLYLK